MLPSCPFARERNMSRRNGGLFIIWGSRNRISGEGQSVQAICPRCQQMAVLEGKEMKRWFTLYFIPIFPTGGGIRFTQCSRCRFQFQANIDQMRSMLNAAPPAVK